jgi:hypothetical protein
MWGWYLKLGHVGFLLHPFQLIIDYQPITQCHTVWLMDSTVKSTTNTKQTETPFWKCDIMYICAHSCLGQSQSKGNKAQKKKQSVVGNYITANKFFI